MTSERGRFVRVGVAFALFCEFFYKVLFTFRPGALLVSIPFYACFLVAAHGYSRALDARHSSRRSADLAYLGGCALAALVILEWWIVGNTPGGSNAIQSAMLLVHGTWALAARLSVADEPSRELVGRVGRRMAWVALLAPMGLLLPHLHLRRLLFLFLPILVYGIAAVAFLRRVLRGRDACPAAPGTAVPNSP